VLHESALARTAGLCNAAEIFRSWGLSGVCSESARAGKAAAKVGPVLGGREGRLIVVILPRPSRDRTRGSRCWSTGFAGLCTCDELEGNWVGGLTVAPLRYQNFSSSFNSLFKRTAWVSFHPSLD
jgi:hypothetical protein